MSDVPDNAPEACPGTGSDNAGKSSACAGCPNQGACSTGQRPVDPDEGVIADRLQNVKHKILVLSGKGGVGKSTLLAKISSYALYVNAHATSTPVGDVAEAMSIASVLPGVAVSSIKGHIGHCLAAAGSLETVATLLSMKEGVLLPTLNFVETDIDADVDLVKDAVRPWRASDRRIALVNSFGFGGAFVSLALAEV